MKEKSISQNFVLNLIKTISSTLFPIITFTYASRVLLVDGIGKVNFAKSVMLYFSMFAQLGIVAYGAREAAKIRDNKNKLSKFVQEMLFINLCSTMISYIVFFVCIITIPLLFDYKFLLLIYSGTIFLNAMGLEWLYNALEEYRYITIRSVVFQAIAIVLLFLLVRDKDDTAEYAFILIFATEGSYVMNFIHVRKIISLHRFNNYDIKKHIWPILILFGYSVSVKIYTTLDITMLGIISGDTAVGLYTAGEKVNKLVNTIITSLGTVLMPRLSYYLEVGYKKKFNYLVERAYKFTFLFSIPAFMGLFMLSDEIILLLSGADFYNAKDTMRLLTPIVLVIPFSVLTNNQILIPMRKENLILISSCVGAGMNLLCNSLLIPKLAENGAAIGTVVAETAVMLVCFYNAQKFFDMRNIFSGTWKYWFAALPIIPIKIVISYLNLGIFITILLTVVLGVCIYFGILCFMRESITFEIIYRVLKLLQKRKNE